MGGEIRIRYNALGPEGRYDVRFARLRMRKGVAHE